MIPLENIISFLPTLPLMITIPTNILYYFFEINFIKNTNILVDTKFILGYIFTIVSTQGLKSIPYPKSIHTYTMRPKGACGCDYLSIKKVNENSPGFPSGHMSSTTFFCVYIASLLYKKNSGYFYYILLSILVIAMAWARIVKKCHNVEQVIGGVFYGILVAYITLSII